MFQEVNKHNFQNFANYDGLFFIFVFSKMKIYTSDKMFPL